MAGFKADVLIQGERVGAAEVQPFLVVAAAQLIVDRQRRGTGGQAEDRVRLGPKERFDGIGR